MPRQRQARLSINLNDDAVVFLVKLRAKGITATETIRRGLALYKLMLDETEAGHRIQIDDGHTIRELVIL